MPASSSTRPRRRGAVRAAARETASTVYRDAILAAAREEFEQRGFASTRMLDVARRAGLSVGALYRHFENKEDLFVSLMQQAKDQVVERMEGAATATRDPRERLAHLIETVLGFIEENRGMFMVFQQLADAERANCHALVHRAEETRERIFAVYRRAIADAVAAGALRNDIAPDDQLAFFTGCMHGFLESWIRGGGEGRLVDKAPIITRLALRALGGTS